MRSKSTSNTARPTARKPDAAAAKTKKTVAVARKSEPIIAVVGRPTPAKQTPELVKKPGELPSPIASFVF